MLYIHFFYWRYVLREPLLLYLLYRIPHRPPNSYFAARLNLIDWWNKSGLASLQFLQELNTTTLEQLPRLPERQHWWSLVATLWRPNEPDTYGIFRIFKTSSSWRITLQYNIGVLTSARGSSMSKYLPLIHPINMLLFRPSSRPMALEEILDFSTFCSDNSWTWRLFCPRTLRDRFHAVSHQVSYPKPSIYIKGLSFSFQKNPF